MSLLHNFDTDKVGLVKPKDIVDKSDININTVIMNFTGSLMDSLIEREMVTLLDVGNKGVNGHYKIYQINGTDIGIYLTMVGAPATVVLMEEFAYALSIKNFVLFGSCGVLDSSKIQRHDMIVPNKAYRDEGTSYHYMERSEYIDIKNYQVVEKFFADNGLHYTTGPTWTTDALFRETKDKVSKMKDLGCLTVEMEISAIQACCNFRGLNFFGFLYGADDLDSTEYDKRGTFEADRLHFETVLALAEFVNKNYK